MYVFVYSFVVFELKNLFRDLGRSIHYFKGAMEHRPHTGGGGGGVGGSKTQLEILYKIGYVCKIPWGGGGVNHSKPSIYYI